jgi:hypothetical protein
MGKSVGEKFWDLRNSGYDGPIDQDGNKVETGPLAEVLDALRRNT